MKKKPVFLCDVIIKRKGDPNIVTILRLARDTDYSGFEITNIMEQIKKDEEIMKTLPILNNNISSGLNMLKWRLFCYINILKKFKEAGFYERTREHIWTSVFEI
jgi:hypothetical protein